MADTPPVMATSGTVPLLPAIGEFNYRVSRYTHPSWLEPLPNGVLLIVLRNYRASEAALSRYLLTQFGMGGQYWFDFSSPLARVALLDEAGLTRLALHAGLAIDSRLIQRAVLREDVRQLRESLGEDAYRFALKRASFLVPAGLFPDPPRYAPQPREQALISGLHCLERAFSDQPVALRRRWVLKLPKAWWTQVHAQTWAATPADCAKLLYKLLIELKLDEHHHVGLPAT